MRSMRGKRTAMPLSWRGLAWMPSKPSSKTSVGRTLRTGPNFSSVWARISAVHAPELRVGEAGVGLGEGHQLQRAGPRGSRRRDGLHHRLRLGGIGRRRLHTAKV
jgi:hypothetical protein